MLDPSPWEIPIYIKMPIVGTQFTELKDFTINIA